MLREQLRQLIRNQVPAEQLQQHIEKINRNLDRAEQPLGEASKDLADTYFSFP